MEALKAQMQELLEAQRVRPDPAAEVAHTPDPAAEVARAPEPRDDVEARPATHVPASPATFKARRTFPK